MRRHLQTGIVGIAVAALALAGCGEDPGVEQGTVHFQGTDTKPLESLSNEMKKKQQDNSYVKKSGEDGKSASGDQGVGESQSAAGPKPATESKPATGSKPATESKPATKGE